MRIARQYLDAARLVEDEGGEMANVCVGMAVLAGIAAADAICADSLGERYDGHDHTAAAAVLHRADPASARKLRRLVRLKSKSHYGASLVSAQDRSTALSAADALVGEASLRYE